MLIPNTTNTDAANASIATTNTKNADTSLLAFVGAFARETRVGQVEGVGDDTNRITLRSELKRRGLTLEEVARRAGYKSQTIRRARSVGYLPDVMLQRLARVMRVDVATVRVLLSLPTGNKR